MTNPDPELKAQFEVAGDALRRGVREALRIPTRNPIPRTAYIVATQVLSERGRQDVQWDEQNHANGTGLPVYEHAARRYRDQTARNAASGVLTWRDVLLEEVYEALAEADPAKLRTELVQVAAVAVAWIEAIDRRTAQEGK